MGASWDVFVAWPEPFEDFVVLVRATLGVELELQPPHHPRAVRWWGHVGDVGGFDITNVWELDWECAWQEATWLHGLEHGANVEFSTYTYRLDALAIAHRVYDAALPRARRVWLVFDGQLEFPRDGATACTAMRRGAPPAARRRSRPLHVLRRSPRGREVPSLQSRRAALGEAGEPAALRCVRGVDLPGRCGLPAMKHDDDVPPRPCPICSRASRAGELHLEEHAPGARALRCSTCREWLAEGVGLAHDDTD